MISSQKYWSTVYILQIKKTLFDRKLIFSLWRKVYIHVLWIQKAKKSLCHCATFYSICNFHFHCPGEKHAYSNLGYLVLGMVIETLSCMPYENYVKQLLRKLDIEEVYVGLTTQQKVDYQEVSSQIRTQSQYQYYLSVQISCMTNFP